MMKYAVLECGQPAVLIDAVTDGWTNNVFNTKEEAIAYAFKWIGDYAWNITNPNMWIDCWDKYISKCYECFEKPYVYDDIFGRTIQIVEVE